MEHVSYKAQVDLKRSDKNRESVRAEGAVWMSYPTHVIPFRFLDKWSDITAGEGRPHGWSNTSRSPTPCHTPGKTEGKAFPPGRSESVLL